MVIVQDLQKRANRETNLELLRIFCMMLIIAHHCVLHGGAVAMEMSINRIFALFILPGGKIGFNCFLALSMWFLVDKQFKAERFLRIWFEVLFYTVTILFVSGLFGTKLNIREWLGAFFPIAGNSHGFAATYLAFYLLIPFLGKILNNINRKQTKWLIVILIYLEVITQLVGSFTMVVQPINSELLLFILCYFISFYLKKWPHSLQNNKIFVVSVFTIIWLMIWILLCGQAYYPGSSLISFLVTNCSNETSLVYIAGGYSLFFVFKSIKIPSISIINTISITTFGILLIHDHNYFRAILWNKIIQTSTWFDSRFFALRLIAVVVTIFVFGAIIDGLRIKIIEKNLFKCNILKKFCGKVDRVMNG